MPVVRRDRIEHASAKDFLASRPDSSVDLVLTDPPYFRVKNLGWDRAWSNPDGFLAWLGGIADEWARALKPNGTLVCFAGCNPAAAPGASMAARVECLLAERLNVVVSAVWVKTDAAGNEQALKMSRASLRAHAPQTERIIICEHYGADNSAKGEAGYERKCDELRGFIFEPLRAYLDGERERAGFTPEQCNTACGHRECGGMAGRHYFSTSQWCLPTRENYEAMRLAFNADGGEHLQREYGHLRRDYGDPHREYKYLRREYEDLRREYEDLRRPFDATAGEHFTDVWTYPTIQPDQNKHPCEKPPEMASDLVLQCSRPGGVVLDTFCGSGVFLAEAARAGRSAWGCDADDHWASVAAAAVEAGEPARGPSTRHLHAQRRAAERDADTGQLGLWGTS